MTVFNVAILHEVSTSSPQDVSAVLTRAGFGVTNTIDVAQFRDGFSEANCALVLSHDAGGDVIPSEVYDTLIPPVVLVTPSRDQLHRFRQNPSIVKIVLEAPVTDRALICAATEAVITNIHQRISYAAYAHPGLSVLLRAVIDAVINGEQRRVTSVAKELRVSIRTLEAHWLGTFGPSSPHLKDFCRGMSFLRLIRIAARHPRLSWGAIQKEQDIARSTLRGAAITFTGKGPSGLNIVTEPASVIASVCARAVPPSLRHWAVETGEK